MTITKGQLSTLGYGFTQDISPTRDEYYWRNKQQKKHREYRKLTSEEILVLKRNGNYSPDWSQIRVSEPFLPEQIHHSKFFGLVRIGAMKPIYLEYKDLRLSCGIYNSHIISSDIGDEVAIHQVRYMSHFIIGNAVILSNINEMETSNNAKFGNGILKEGDPEERRIWLELCNENGGRSVLPFDGMTAADAYLWTRDRHDEVLQNRFIEMTEIRFPKEQGFYSEIDDQTVLKNSNTIKDVKIGPFAYIKGVNKLKNVTINSSEKAYTQIGEGCEIVNGIVGIGCRIFYGVKAVRFILSPFSQLKYGARLINSFLGENSTISCCEVLNSLLYPAHEQHHNNSFLCAAWIQGQSNMAAGATIGSNHNSRAADGEIVAKRGFWPGLCVSLKHNSKFASYVLLVKGDFLHELNIRIPFSLVSNDATKDQLVIIPGYWFLYNMYALMRNTSKFLKRDNRAEKLQYYEYEILAPDTINEIFEALKEIEYAVGKAFSNEHQADEYGPLGKEILSKEIDLSTKEILLENTENSNRKVILIKVKECYTLFKKLIRYYAATQLVEHFTNEKCIQDFLSNRNHDKSLRRQFENIGGQLVPKHDIAKMIDKIKQGDIESWEDIHQHYHIWSKDYPSEKLRHAIASLEELTGVVFEKWDVLFVKSELEDSIHTKSWICKSIHNSRIKDYENPYKQMIYDSYEEMEAVVGNIKDNAFIMDQKEEFIQYQDKVQKILMQLP